MSLIAQQCFFVASLILANQAFAANSPFTTHPENTWLKQSPREDVAAP